MSKRAKTRPDVTAEQVNLKVNAATTAAERRAWQAIAMIYQGGKTAAEIARALKRKQSWFYNVKREFILNGLNACFGRQRPARVGWKLTPELKKLISRRFAKGISPLAVRTCLSQKGINISLGYLYRCRKQWGLVPKKCGRGMKKNHSPRRDRLKVNIPQVVMHFLAVLLSYPGAIPYGRQHKKLSMLWILGWRQKEIKNPKAMIPKRNTLTSELKCSPSLIYQVADAWRAGAETWDEFVRCEFGGVTRRNIKLVQRQFEAGELVPKYKNAIDIRPADGINTIFENGDFRIN